MAKGGVYEILNTASGKRYVGSAVNLPRRKKEHWRGLRGNCHPNQRLQNSWNKYGESAFEFGVIEYWEPEFLVSFEQWWMNMLRTEYNIAPVAGNSLGVKRTDEFKTKQREREATDETRARLSAALAGNKNCLGRKLSVETRAKISKALKGHKISEETKAKISASLRRYHE